MNTDTAIVLLLAELRARIGALEAENAALRERLDQPAD